MDKSSDMLEWRKAYRWMTWHWWMSHMMWHASWYHAHQSVTSNGWVSHHVTDGYVSRHSCHLWICVTWLMDKTGWFTQDCFIHIRLVDSHKWMRQEHQPHLSMSHTHESHIWSHIWMSHTHESHIWMSHTHEFHTYECVRVVPSRNFPSTWTWVRLRVEVVDWGTVTNRCDVTFSSHFITFQVQCDAARCRKSLF